MAKSIREQIAAKEAAVKKLNDEITALKAQADTEVNPADIVQGVTVTFDYGKGTTRRELTGVVTGVKLSDPAVPKSQTLVRVAVGVGFDAEIVTIYPANVKKLTIPEVAQ